MMGPDAPTQPPASPPDAVLAREALESLIEEARAHELGLEFLIEGAPESVAITFGVHAFVVDAAKDLLRTTRGVR
jgi:hypothetical protein